MRPRQYDVRHPAAKGNNITHVAVAPSNLNTAITLRCAETELPNTIELCARASEIAGPKPDLDAKAEKDDFEELFKRIFTRKIASPKMEKLFCQIIIAALMQPLQYHLRCLAAKDNSITHAAAAPSNLDAAITLRFAASRGQPASLYAHGNKTRQQSCSHYTAICNQRFKKRIESRTHEQPLVAEHRGGTDLGSN